jgi:hypothetical protein
LLYDDVFISSGFYQKPYALIDKKGEFFKEFGEYPAYWDGNPVELLQFNKSISCLVISEFFLKLIKPN